MNQLPTTTAPPAHSVIPVSYAEQKPEGMLLREKQNPSCLFIFLLIFTIFWNLVSWPTAALFLWGNRTINTSSPFAFLTLLPLVFVAVGIVLIVVTARMGLIATAFGPAELLVSHLPLRLGDRASIRFRRHVRGNRTVTALKARLVCREWVRYRVGTDTRTMTHKVWSQDLMESSLPPMLTGEVDTAWSITIPTDQPPSFSATDNALEWQVEVTMQIERFPDPTAIFLLPVLPEVVQ